MISELKDLLKSTEFRTWLANPQLWESLDVDYHPPRVERVWMKYNEMRVSLHVIHPCKENEALLHPHPWKSGMYILPIGGIYEHAVGYQDVDEFGNKTFKIVCTQQFRGDAYYEMLERKSVHYVRPIGLPVYSIMISGPKIWDGNGTKVDKDLGPLSNERKAEILNIFKTYFE